MQEFGVPNLNLSLQLLYHAVLLVRLLGLELLNQRSRLLLRVLLSNIPIEHPYALGNLRDVEELAFPKSELEIVRLAPVSALKATTG